MWKIPKSYSFDYGGAIIVSDYCVLLEDENPCGAQPILFFGRNDEGWWILGSSVSDDYVKGVERFFHIVLNEMEFEAYRARKVSYRSLLQQCRRIYVIDQYVQTKKTKAMYSITFEDIPDGYSPLEGSYYPANEVDKK